MLGSRACLDHSAHDLSRAAPFRRDEADARQDGRFDMGSPGEKPYLEDLAVGLEFQSVGHPLDAVQIKAFASRFDPPALT